MINIGIMLVLSEMLFFATFSTVVELLRGP